MSGSGSSNWDNARAICGPLWMALRRWICGCSNALTIPMAAPRVFIRRGSSPDRILSSLLAPRFRSAGMGRRPGVARSRVQLGGKEPDRRALEKTDDRQGLFKLLLDHRDHLDRPQRVPARL